MALSELRVRYLGTLSAYLLFSRDSPLDPIAPSVPSATRRTSIVDSPWPETLVGLVATSLGNA